MFSHVQQEGRARWLYFLTVVQNIRDVLLIKAFRGGPLSNFLFDSQIFQAFVNATPITQWIKSDFHVTRQLGVTASNGYIFVILMHIVHQVFRNIEFNLHSLMSQLPQGTERALPTAPSLNRIDASITSNRLCWSHRINIERSDLSGDRATCEM